jgi:hypothetical protein
MWSRDPLALLSQGMIMQDRIMTAIRKAKSLAATLFHRRVRDHNGLGSALISALSDPHHPR